MSHGGIIPEKTIFFDGKQMFKGQFHIIYNFKSGVSNYIAAPFWENLPRLMTLFLSGADADVMCYAICDMATSSTAL